MLSGNNLRRCCAAGGAWLGAEHHRAARRARIALPELARRIALGRHARQIAGAGLSDHVLRTELGALEALPHL